MNSTEIASFSVRKWAAGLGSLAVAIKIRDMATIENPPHCRGG